MGYREFQYSLVYREFQYSLVYREFQYSLGYREFQYSLGYIEKPCLGKPNQNTIKIKTLKS